ncbi:MAG: hypothetical protein HFG49_08315 [Lachnospiraceae bacterium]|jgi:phage baseplate assembly protein W|nr:hypothetical protein [Lachnospiraceae bacterium]
MEFHFLYLEGFTKTQKQEISKNLQNIFCIPAGSIPLNRKLGLSWQNLSQIPPDMENDYATELIEKAEKFEPRVSVDEVTFHYDTDGNVIVDIALEKRGDDGEG